ncbi:MAG TPA: PQQ-binding-like beta-propeller repeat protein [Pirellulales bacterium]|nr:PQQ-binding-like beta-propeller repeat protein [Pirellulales bacterium]
MMRGRFWARCNLTLVVASFAACWASEHVHAENWPGWRGPARNGLSNETGLPVSWSEKQGVHWRVALPGSGISNPIVWGERVFVTSSDGRNQDELHLICLARDDGSEKWHLRLWGSAPTLYHPTKSSMASPSPVTDGEHIFAFYGSGDVVCVDFDGGLVWQRSLASEYGPFENRFAASSSPLLYRDLLVLQCDHYGPSYLLAIDKATGANRWKADRPDVWLSWSSPQLTPPATGKAEGELPVASPKRARVPTTTVAPAITDVRDELLVCGSHRLDAYDPTTGEKLWTVGGLSRECVPTPVFGHGLIFATTGPNGQTVCVRPGGKGDVTDSHVVWSNPRGSPFVPSPVLVGDRLYLVDDKGVGTCLDARSGRLAWRKRFGGAFTASPVAGDGKAYFCDESGQTIVVATDTDKYRELARNQLGEAIFASPAISQSRLFIRTATHLYCLGVRP